MSIVRRIARPLLATGYVANGVESFRNSSSAAQHLAPVVTAAGKAFPQAGPALGNPAMVAQGLAAAQVGAAVLFALGRLPRLSAGVLVTTTALNAYADYRAAEAGTPEQKAARRSTAFKNSSLVGAVMLAAVDTEGSPSLLWRAEHLAEDVRKNARKLGKDTQKQVARAEKAVQHAVKQS
ncbi:DoxX family membrane protein [Kocuria flava]|uniref:DoxX family membrane protein n=1 Tax=Kocuria flava TaxID=446860 RepID=UPI001FF16D83|nr:DoxX family membrane protein [Kocuria flava]MCJ8504471.1 DoxX family membrane protein [Kocuria flava]